ncbi:MAG: aldo/keto reductase [Kiritimatiellae bacterium]|jgi:aryl-alcohol dehydrogenase-like predicted oxidoreductase|nr:aldo/keto reductase [Kiritimatiellia bacterium]
MSNLPPKRTLGASSIEVSEIGLGCNRIGENIHLDSEWIAMLHRAIDLGVTIFDTAAQYAGGRSEELIGKAFGNRQDVIIASKVSPVNTGNKSCFTRNSVIEGAERSLRELNRDCIDIFQTHGSGTLDQICNSEWAEGMAMLKKQGKIRLRGAAVFDAKGAIYAIEKDLVDVLQITYNLIDTAHAVEILPLAEKHGVGLIARMPFQRGILTGKFSPSNPNASNNRARLQGKRLLPDILEAERYREFGEKRPGGMEALAIQFVLAEKRLSCTIPGARSIEQLEANVAAAAASTLTIDEAIAIAEIHNKTDASNGK